MADVMISGSDGPIEVSYHAAPPSSSAPVILVAPPHPVQDGTMRHKVVYALFRIFAAMGFGVLRFNFRGSGKTPGVFGEGENEITDAATCLDWLRAHHPLSKQCWVSGFSFGSWVAMQLLMRRPEISRFIAISPPANLCDFNFLSPCPSSGLIVHGDHDEIISKESILKLVCQLSAQRKRNQVDFQLIKGADHNYTQHLDDLAQIVQAYVMRVLEEEARGTSAPSASPASAS